MPDQPESIRRVLLLREPDGVDPYEEAFRDAGYEPVSVPVLRFTFVNQALLRANLERPAAYGGLLLTSPRAAEALAEALSWLPSETVRWHARRVFAVGPATAAVLREAGFAPEGEGSGTADMLADYITRQEFDGPLLFLCGNRRRDVLPDRLRAAGVPLDELCVYETHLRDGLDLTSFRPPFWAAFFSPSGVEAVQRAGGFAAGAVRCAAIGLTTAEALAQAGQPPVAVAADPTPEALVAAVLRADAADLEQAG